MKLGSQVISFLSGEWMLNHGRPNGGDVVVFRTLWVGALLIAVLAVVKALESTGALPGAAWDKAIGMMQGSDGPVVFGAVYLAFYARFASQWTYMANLYNQIKQAEVTMLATLPVQALPPTAAGAPSSAPIAGASAANALAQWKAGFIEDALAVHMATKPAIAAIIRAWYGEQAVKDAFAKHTLQHHEKLGWLQVHGVLP